MERCHGGLRDEHPGPGFCVRRHRSEAVPQTDPHAQYAGAIQLAFDAEGQRNCGEIPVGTASTLYVVALTAGPTQSGITGAELRVEGIPAGWVATATNPPSNIALGDPLGAVGGNMAYRSCQSPLSGTALLYTISVFATTSVTDHAVAITARTPPSNENFDCPAVTLCDDPVYTIACMAGSQARINQSAGTICDRSPLAVESKAWAAMRDLYR